MKKFSQLTVVVIGCILFLTILPTVSRSEDSSSWWPQWKAPDVTGAVKKTTRSVTRTTKNAWQATSRTTKKAWDKTAAALDPFPDDPKPITNNSPWASSSSSTPAPKKKKSTSEGGMFSWFGGSTTKTEEKPATVQDFLKQERPN